MSPTDGPGPINGQGPLAGLRVVEMAGQGPAPFCGMLLADMGADVLRLDRADAARGATARKPPVLSRGRRSVAVDLKAPAGVGVALRLLEQADVLLEGFRPGVMERLGLGPDACLSANPRLVYSRMTGWGQRGPLATAAGHDINYIAVAGALAPIGRAGSAPVPPLNVVGDYGGGGMLLAFGVLCALHERTRSGCGQVVDAAMVDGAALLTTVFHELLAQGSWRDERGVNLVDSGAPFYEVYETADGRHVAVGAIEPQFFAELMARAEIDPGALADQQDASAWPAAKEHFAAVFRTKTRAEWCALLEGTDACFAPVLSLAEAPDHPHVRARATFTDVEGRWMPSPAPRFSRSGPELGRPSATPGQDTITALADWGFTDEEVERLQLDGVVVAAS
jgi:alpha-methylacyl-CoA racemase